MKKTLLLLFTLLCVVSFALPAFAEMKYEHLGFRDIPWGTPMPKNNIFGFNKLGMVLDEINPFPGEKSYYRKKENLTLAEAALTGIEYIFLEGFGFCAVRIFFKGDENYKLLLDACVANWGKPDKTRPSDVVWIGKSVTCSLYYSRILTDYPKQGELSIGSGAYYDPIERDARMMQKRKGF